MRGSLAPGGGPGQRWPEGGSRVVLSAEGRRVVRAPGREGFGRQRAYDRGAERSSGGDRREPVRAQPGRAHHRSFAHRLLCRLRDARRGDRASRGRRRSGRDQPLRLGLLRVPAYPACGHRHLRTLVRRAWPCPPVRARYHALFGRTARRWFRPLDAGADRRTRAAGVGWRRHLLHRLRRHRAWLRGAGQTAHAGTHVDCLGGARPGWTGDRRAHGRGVRLAVGLSRARSVTGTGGLARLSIAAAHARRGAVSRRRGRGS